jgi:hypothetical protein
MVAVQNNKKNNTNNDELVSALLRLKIQRPKNFDWKEDYAKALEEKYENICRR